VASPGSRSSENHWPAANATFAGFDRRLVLSCGPMEKTERPKGELVTQTIAMPRDTNRNGDIFGGWLVSQMDLGGAILASKIAKARIVTVAMEGMSFLQPVRVGDTVACYARLEKVGSSSMRIPIEAWANRFMTGEEIRVTEGVFVYVAVDDSGRPIPIQERA
jgi:acyl-CoA thioesterase YciA